LTALARRKIVRANPVKLRAWRAAGANFLKNRRIRGGMATASVKEA
jgi:hypothetical protein